MAQHGIGDAVLLLPLLRGLKARYPQSTVELIGKPFLSDLFSDEGCCDAAHVLSSPWAAYAKRLVPTITRLRSFYKQVRDIRHRRFDWLISTRYDPREVMQLWLLGGCQIYGFIEAGGRYWIDHDYGIDRVYHDSMHRSELADAMLKRLAPDATSGSPMFLKNPVKQAIARQWLRSQGYRGGQILAVHSGGANPIRHWREPTFSSVIKQLTIQPAMVVFICESDSPMVQESDSPMIQDDVPYAIWKGDLTSLKALLSVCDVFLGSDSGVMHIAGAAGCRVVAPFGPTEPRWFSPVGKHIIVAPPIFCRGCMDMCIFDHPKCFDLITDQMLASAVNSMMGGG